MVLLLAGTGTYGRWCLSEEISTTRVARVSESFTYISPTGSEVRTGGLTSLLRVGEAGRPSIHRFGGLIYLCVRCSLYAESVTISLGDGTAIRPQLSGASPVSGNRFFVVELAADAPATVVTLGLYDGSVTLHVPRLSGSEPDSAWPAT